MAKAGQYNWEQNIHHVNSKRRTIGRQPQRKIPKRHHIQTENDVTISRDAEFGPIRMTIIGNNSQNEDDWVKEFTFRKCGETFFTKCGIVGHIAWKHREIAK